MTIKDFISKYKPCNGKAAELRRYASLHEAIEQWTDVSDIRWILKSGFIPLNDIRQFALFCARQCETPKTKGWNDITEQYLAGKASFESLQKAKEDADAVAAYAAAYATDAAAAYAADAADAAYAAAAYVAYVAAAAAFSAIRKSQLSYLKQLALKKL